VKKRIVSIAQRKAFSTRCNAFGIATLPDAARTLRASHRRGTFREIQSAQVSVFASFSCYNPIF
ncbi:MAG: hypothetical protein ACYT04_84495, partial [Nostoc sp.]